MTQPGFRLKEDVPIRLNLSVDLIYPDGRVAEHHRSHNIITNTGKQFMAQVITASSFAPLARHNNEVVQYMGFGIGGSRQSNSDALNPSSAISLEYPGTNVQTDIDVTVDKLERPVKVTSAPLWMKEIAVPGTFPSLPITSTQFISTFEQAEINFGGFSTVPISEIALFKSGADPSLPNGTLGLYPGTGGEVIAYDTFSPIEKSGLFAIQVRWEWRF